MTLKNNSSRKLYRNFLLFSAAVRSVTCAETLSQELDVHITDPQADALRFLFLNEHASMGKIAVGLGYTTSGATKAINRLEKKGWVVRHARSDDHREVSVSMTPRGREIATRIIDITERRMHDLLSVFPKETLSCLDRMIEEFLKKITSDGKISHKLCVACGFEGRLDCTNSTVDCAVASTRREENTSQDSSAQ